MEIKGSNSGRDGISRRAFVSLSVLSPLLFQASAFAREGGDNKPAPLYRRTRAVLQESFRAEMVAYRHYEGYTSKALREKYPNIAYLFRSFSHSEKIHAENYRRILATLGDEVKPVEIEIDVGETKPNLQKAAQNELRKIRATYPDFLKELETESHEEAIIGCMYSWKSHKQHEEKLNEILKYSGMFFGSVSGRIEGMNLDLHVCRVCGSTIDRAPDSPCIICNKSRSNYRKIERPR